MTAEDYDWITDEMFYDKLTEIIDREPASKLLTFAGVWETLSETLNNPVLEELEAERDELIGKPKGERL